MSTNEDQERSEKLTRPISMCSWGPGGRELVMVTDMAAWIDGQAAEVARGLQLPTAPNSDGALLAADFKTESLEAVDSIVRGVGCICPTVDTSTYDDPDATMPGYDSRCGVHGGK